ncbi:MAG: transposase, partial [Phycisphaerae bacterium]
VVFSAYGFWLPNDPRGSWSRYIAARRLLSFGDLVHPKDRHSHADSQRAVQRRFAAKRALLHPIVVFSGTQAWCIAKEIGATTALFGVRVYALSVMPEHVHLVISSPPFSLRRFIGHIKSRATKSLEKENLRPGVVVWSRNCWGVILDDGNDIRAASEYVMENPITEGKRMQHWSFVRPLRYDQLNDVDAK